MFDIHNVVSWDVYTILLTQSFEPNTGIVRYNGQLVRDLCDLFEVGEESYHSVAGKVLHMIGVVNDIRLADHERRRLSEKAKIGGRPDDDLGRKPTKR